MGKIKLGSIVVDIRGKVGGHVYSKNRGGSYMKNKVTPSNPQTSSQTSIRAVFTSLSQGWRDLTNDERLQRESAVQGFARTDVFGDVKNPTGNTLYIRLNMNIING